MKKAGSVVAAVVFFIVVFGLPAGSQADDRILEFDVLAAVTEPFTGTANPIRGVPGGGLPWIISDAKGELRLDGGLRVDVRGLVLANRAPVPENLRGTNPIPNFRAIVSCRSIDGTGDPSIVNVSTDNFPASPAGDSRIEATVDVPTPCFAPIIFVTSPTGAWFAITGR